MWQSNSRLPTRSSIFSPRKTAPGVLLFLVSTFVLAESSDWKAPPTYVNRPNPVPANSYTIGQGQQLYVNNCLICHGPAGRGDGPGGAALEKRPADLGAKIKASGESDGELFWKITEGRSPMLSWKGSLTETQRWEIVNYIKTFAGK